ncbi:MAG: DNA repair exonuclease [Verrucomicrobiota bacterium]
MSVTFLHTADWQLGKPFARVSDVAKRSRLQNERFACLKRVAAAAAEQRVAFILVAGDLFDSPSPVNATVAKACEAIGAMQVPVLVIPGNHDHGGPGSLWEQPFFIRQQERLAPNLRLLLTPEPVVLDRAVVFPAPLMRRKSLADPSAWIRSAFEAPSFPPELVRIVLAHGSIQGFGAAQDDEDEDAGSSNIIDLSRLPEAQIDYIALGDWHGTKQVGSKAWYCGTPEIDRFPKGGNNDPGNILVVQAGRGLVPQVEKLATGQFRWNEFSYQFSEDGSLAAFCAKLDENIGAWGQDSLLRLALEGSLAIEGSRLLQEHLEGLDARLLRLKLEDRVNIAATEAEIQQLASRPDDPLVAAVASQLLVAMAGEDATGIARIALRELHAACAAAH